MTRDFNKDLTIMVAGSGNVTMQHLEESMAEWIFGPVEEREVHVILPILSNMGGALRNLVKLGTEWEFKFTIVHPRNGAMTKEISALPEDAFIHVDDEREALEAGLSLLTAAHKGGNETAFIHAYNPANTYEQGNEALSDFEIIGDAKNYQWLTTLNLCEGLIDSFEGYKSTDEILKEERLKKEFEEKQAAEEAAKPKEEKKAPAPRKRAAKKVAAPTPKPLETEPEKALEDVPETSEELAKASVEASIEQNISKGPNPHRDPLPGNPIHDDPRNALSANVPVVIGTPDIQQDIQEAHWYAEGAKVEKRHMIAVSKVDLAQLASDIKGLTDAFGGVMDTFTRIIKDS